MGSWVESEDGCCDGFCDGRCDGCWDGWLLSGFFV